MVSRFSCQFVSAMDACINRDVHNKHLVCSGVETSEQSLTCWGNSKGEETCRVHVESPARWGYAIAMESEKKCDKCYEIYEKYEQMRANYERINANYEQIKATYGQIHAKYKQLHAK